MRRMLLTSLAVMAVCVAPILAQDRLLVRPAEINDVLVNPGIGFTTFQRFNGDTLNAGAGWTEGFPIEYQKFTGNLTNKDHPQTSIVYFRVYWKFLQPEANGYNWEMIDKALKTAAERGQDLMLRIAPYGGGPDKDVPDWYRKMVGPEDESRIAKLRDDPDNPQSTYAKWRVDAEDPRYVQYFGGMIRDLGQRYDGHPDLDCVDVSIVGFWGEGAGSHLLSDRTRKALLRAYLDNFKKTPLIFQPLNGDAPEPGVLVRGLPIAAYWPDGTNNGEGPEMRHLGWRVDCLGDLGFWRGQEARGDWCHMFDVYPEDIIRSGMKDAWKKAPITMEICGTFRSWRDRQGYGPEQVKYIFDKALEWHISSFNAKSSPVPPEWMPLVNDWLRKMGYRLVLRKFTCPAVVAPHHKLIFQSWWVNRGVAPCYRDYPLALRLKNSKRTEVLLTDADIRGWLPGDSIYDDGVVVPLDMPPGDYDLSIAVVDRDKHQPVIKLAISGGDKDGWYALGKIKVQ